MVEAACLPAAYMTAFYALYQIVHLPPKALLLVHSAAGGVGSALAMSRLDRSTGIHSMLFTMQMVIPL